VSERVERGAGPGTPGASQTATTTFNRAATFNGAAQWPYWLGALIILAGLAWYAIDRQGRETVAEQPAPTRTATGTVGVAPADLTVDGGNLANQFNSSVSTLRGTLPSIHEATT